MSNAEMLAALRQTNSSLDPIRKQLTGPMLTGRMDSSGIMEADPDGWKILKRLFIDQAQSRRHAFYDFPMAAETIRISHSIDRIGFAFAFAFSSMKIPVFAYSAIVKFPKVHCLVGWLNCDRKGVMAMCTPNPEYPFCFCHFALSLSATSVPSFGGRPHVRVTMTRSLCRPSITIMFCL